MRPYLLFAPAMLLALAASTPAVAQRGAENRCGWLSNPTPGNYWLRDRQGEWLLSSQGGFHARGIDNLPDMTTRGWRRTNGEYGYGCACLSVLTDHRNRRITRLYSAQSRPLAQCERDRGLPRRP
jgi:Protein of unknown function (DUF4087)